MKLGMMLPAVPDRQWELAALSLTFVFSSSYDVFVTGIFVDTITMLSLHR